LRRRHGEKGQCLSRSAAGQPGDLRQPIDDEQGDARRGDQEEFGMVERPAQGEQVEGQEGEESQEDR